MPTPIHQAPINLLRDYPAEAALAMYYGEEVQFLVNAINQNRIVQDLREPEIQPDFLVDVIATQNQIPGVARGQDMQSQSDA